ncbi:MAG TPA: protein kinase [Acidobacteriaceae bacterium]|nr:protein kinase [Acidobacteriaceae bacterium]
MPELKNSISQGEVVAGNYRILSVAGSGGMGVVYRALDLKLERQVALKFLPSDLNANPKERERFLREAKIASSLDHPNIGVIHGVEETADGKAFIIMAFYDGVSLAKMTQGGPMPAYLAIDIASQMAKGLGEAHSRGVVHRDVKPSNVMVTSSGVAKIVDFGLAHASSSTKSTQTGIAGTVAYMAPEQAMGEKVDHRCDIWALGVVLTEMLTGGNPFQGDSMGSIFFSILNSAPEGVDALHPALQPVIYKALSKDVNNRFQSCAEFSAALEKAKQNVSHFGDLDPDATVRLSGSAAQKSREPAETRRLREEASRSALRPAPRRRRWVTPVLVSALALVVAFCAVWFVPSLHSHVATMLGVTPEQKHIAVLPFDNIGSNPENQVLIDGLLESLTGRLSNLDVGNQSLWVVPNSVVESRHVTDPTAALKELGATLVIKGAVERNGTDIHLTANLIDTKTLRQLGSVDVDDPAGDLSTLEDETVAKLAQLMDINVTAGMLRNTGGRVDPAAYEGYLKALGYMDRYDKPGNLDLAIAALKQSIQTDPQFALGYAAAGEAYRLKYRVDQNLQWLNEAQAYSQKAVELDNSIPAVYVTLAQIHDELGQHDLSVQEYQHALQLDPKDAAALEGMARSFENAGRVADAEKTFERAAALQPNNWAGYNDLGTFYHRQGKYQQAIAAFKQALQLTPDNSEAYFNLGATYVDQGGAQSLALGEQALKKSIEISPSYVAYANLGLLYMEENRYQDAAAMTEKALQMNDKNYMVWNNLMLAYAGANEPDKAAMARHRAEQLAEKVVAMKPQDALTQSTLATMYAQDRDVARAESKIETSLALAPNNPDVLSNVGEAYEFLGERVNALHYIEKSISKGYAVEAIEDDPNLKALTADPRFKTKLK